MKRKRGKQAVRKRKRKKQLLRRSEKSGRSRLNTQREAVKAEVLDNLETYLKQIPELRERLFKEILANKVLYQKIAQRVAEEVT